MDELFKGLVETLRRVLRADTTYPSPSIMEVLRDIVSVMIKIAESQELSEEARLETCGYLLQVSSVLPAHFFATATEPKFGSVELDLAASLIELSRAVAHISLSR